MKQLLGSEEVVSK